MLEIHGHEPITYHDCHRTKGPSVRRHPPSMKPIFLLTLATATCYADGAANLLATSEWSAPVSTKYGQSLQARLILSQEHSPAHTGSHPETALYVELRNVSGAVGAPMQIYFDPGHGLSCELRDADGKSAPGGGPGSGGGPDAGWITLPYDATIRLRANMYGYGRAEGEGLLLTLHHGAAWSIPAGETKDYFLSGTLTLTPPAGTEAKTAEEARKIWSGTLVLPKSKIILKKP